MKKMLIIISLLSSISFAQASESCYQKENIGTIGTEGLCEGRLIVDNDLLRKIIKNNSDYSSDNIFTGQVTSMRSLFSGKTVIHDITSWDVSNVKTMELMFFYADFNQPIGKWNTEKVEDVSYMFVNTKNFDQNLSSWNMQSVKKNAAFALSENFKRIDEPFFNLEDENDY